MALQTTLYPVADAEFQTDSPNYNAGTVNSITVGDEDFTSTKYRAVMKFDFSSLPSTSVITDAYLRLYFYADASNGNGRIKVYRTTSNWTETGVTWNTQPSYDSTVISYVDLPADYVNQYANITGLASIVDDWHKGRVPNYGFFFRCTESWTDNENDKAYRMRSREWGIASQRPQLIITYYYAPSVSTSSATNVLSNKATLNGNITSVNGDNATTRGFQYGLSQTPTWDVHENGSFGAGAYSLNISGLKQNKVYYFRAYATNHAGTTYGSWVSFKTKAAGGFFLTNFI